MYVVFPYTDPGSTTPMYANTDLFGCGPGLLMARYKFPRQARVFAKTDRDLVVESALQMFFEPRRED